MTSLAPLNAAAYILFAEDFDGEPEAPVDLLLDRALPEPAEARFSLAEMEAARADSYAAGVASERERLANADALARARTIEALGIALADARQAARAASETAAEAIARAVLSVVAAALPALCADHGENEVRALLRHLLPAIASEPTISVRVHRRVVDAVRADLAQLDGELAGVVHLVASDAVAPGDARVTWDGGLCQRSVAAACAAVRDGLASLNLLLPDASSAEAPSAESTRNLETAHVQ